MAKSISVKIGSYENKEGKVVGKYTKIGNVITRNDGSMSIKFDEVLTNYLKALFGADYEGWANVYDNEKADSSSSSSESTASGGDDDLPF